ncbi:MAG: cytochrome c biogenesis protein CcsA [Saprospiraceae bacterium]
MKLVTYLRKINQIIFSTTAAGFYLLLLAASIGIATFIENDFGTSSAQSLIFKARWFEILLMLLGGTIISNIFRFRFVQQKKWASLLFHSAIIIIILGAGITRYFGFEGMMHIREGESSQTFLSSENYLNFKVLSKNKTYSFSEPVHFSTLGNNKFEEIYQIGSDIIETKVVSFLPNPLENIVEDEDGVAVMKIVVGGTKGREEFFIKQGDRVHINGVNFNFTDELMPNAFNVKVQNDSLYFSTDEAVTQTVMATQKKDTILPSAYRPLLLRALYVKGSSGFVIGDFRTKAKVEFSSGEAKMKNESAAGLRLEIIKNGEKKELFLIGRKGIEGQPKVADFGDFEVAVHYGAQRISVPFNIGLRDFIMERYPGTNNPSSYASEVTLSDKNKGVQMDYRIYMNNILDYGGYRFFQSSYDQDEAGTYLSVNYDFWGTWTSYIGYILLTIGMIMTFFIKNSRFSFLARSLKSSKATYTILLFLCFLFWIPNGHAQDVSFAPNVNKDVACAFGKMIVQDHRGRFKPMNTLSSEVLRKVAKKDQLFGLSSDQIFLSMVLDPTKWEKAPLIDIGTHPEIKKILGVTDRRISYRQFFNDEAQYKLRDYVREAQAMNPKDQGTFEKAIIKLDEKINITNMVFSARFLAMFPKPNDPNHTWLSPADIQEMDLPSTELLKGYEDFIALVNLLSSKELEATVEDINPYIMSISQQQRSASDEVLPSTSRIKAELLLNTFDVFGHLKNVYALISLLFLGLFFYSIFYQKMNVEKITLWAFWILLACFLCQTIGLGLRWYVSGRAPWSNGYESMIYISWTTVLAGLIFSRKSLGGMAATTVLAATILLVAAMSWLDPEITPLVPVLKSYWLTIHVSLEAGSYGFLMLGAVVGMLNLVIMIFTKTGNKDRMKQIIQELTQISEITLLGGLFMVSVGTYLGGVWANESWGRYWGWDAKETWALVTILVYAFILHMRFIPGLKSLYAFNVASLFGFATVIMTYFGVNYYLSGLHSYAAGDPVPIPPQVYYTAIVLAIISILALFNWRKLYK